MSFSYLSNTPLDEAQELYFKRVKDAGFGGKTKIVPVSESAGMITAKAVYASMSAPHYLASAMDGISVRAKDCFGATETTPVILNTDQFVMVDTGDQIPEGMDAVVMIEEVIWQGNGSCKIATPVAPWQHIRQIGEDICMGEMIVSSFNKITPATVGSMLAAGVLEVEVIDKIKVAIIPTGDEIVPPTDNPKPGDIVEFNSSMFSAMLKDWGAQSVVLPIVKDNKEMLQSAMKKALAESDMVLMLAGSSAGRDDYTTETIDSFGEVICHGISVRPGKPAVLGISGDKPVFGIPGYPVSGIVVMDYFVKQLVDMWYHRAGEKREQILAKLTKTIVSGLKYRELVRVRLGLVNNEWVASPLARGAGVISSFMKADAILDIPQNVEGYERGDEVKLSLLRPLSEIKNSVVVIGSHDPLIDEIGDMMRMDDPACFMNSSHVGSMGGIMAIKRGECHMAGIHLLDEEDGSYNLSYLKKYLPSGGYKLIRTIGRTQGLMIQKGNPKNITGILDLAKDNIRYVNRQNGAGTRVLFDYLLAGEGIDKGSINGYEREELTHTSVAAQIASNTADAGMGIYSAANIYGLDFIEICTETYDIIVTDSAWESPAVQKIVEILKSKTFEDRLKALGGYSISPMEIIKA